MEMNLNVNLKIEAAPAVVAVINAAISAFGNTPLGIGPNTLQEVVQNPAPVETQQAAPKKSRAKKEDPKPEPTPAPAPAPEPTQEAEMAEEKSKITFEDLRSSALEFRNAKPENKAALKTLMESFGIEKLSALDEDKFADFLDQLKAL